MKKILLITSLSLLARLTVFAQAPVITYANQQTYTTGTAIPVLKPVNTGGAVPSNAYGQVTTFAGTAGITGSANGQGPAASFFFPAAITSDKAGNLYVADGFDYLVRKISPTGVVTTFAGSGSYGAVNGPAASASFYNLTGIVTDAAGNVYVSDAGNELIRKITPSGLVTTFAGTVGKAGAANGQGTNASFNGPGQMTIDKNGNLYVSDYGNYVIRKITPGGLVSTFAGKVGVAGSANGPDTLATFRPTGCAIDSQGNVYVADEGNNLIRKISTTGIVSTFAGSGKQGFADGAGTAASFYQPNTIFIDAIGNLYVGDEANDIVRKITPAGVVTTLAGTAGTYASNDGIGAAARFKGPYAITGDAAGNLFVADYGGCTIRKIIATGYSIDKPLPPGMNFDLLTGNISGTPTVITPSATYTISAYNIYGSSTTTLTIGITGTLDFAPISPKVYGTADFVPAITTNEVLGYTSSNPSVATIVSGKIHIKSVGRSIITASNGSSVISQTLTVTPAPLTIIADNKSRAYQATNPILTLTYRGFTAGDTISKLTATPVITTSATASSVPGSYPITVSSAADSNYSITYVPGLLTVLGNKIKTVAPEITYANKQTYTIGKTIVPLKPTNTGGAVPLAAYAKVTTLAGKPGVQGFSNGTGTAATFTALYGVAVDRSGNIFVSDQGNNLVRKITPAGVVSTFAGSQGISGSANGLGTSASFNFPSGISIDTLGNIYVADQANNLIRKITPTGLVSTFAGTGVGGSTDGFSTQATFYGPTGIATDKAGDMYVDDGFNILIRKITSSGYVSTFAGQKGVQGVADGQGTSATFTNPDAVTTDISGNIYIADRNNLRKITPSGFVSTLVGSRNNENNFGLDTGAVLGLPEGLTTDAVGNIYVPDNGVIKRVSPAGVVTLIAGAMNSSGSADGIGTSAKLLGPRGLTIDTSGNLYIADYTLIRKMSIVGYAIDKTLPPGLSFDPTTGIISGTPTAASPATNYTITGNNVGGASTSVINIKVPAITSLAKLTASSGTLSPSFTGNVTSYILPVAANLTSITIIPTVSDTSSRIMVNGLAVMSGKPSEAITLTSGLNSINVVITGTDSTSTAYTIDITRLAANNNATLANLTISAVSLTPVFAPATTSYTASVASTVSSITITPSASDTGATLKVNGIALKSGITSAPISLITGSNIIKVAVTARDGTTISTYTVDVTRAAGNNDSLSALTISSGTLTPAFAPGTLSYTASLQTSDSTLVIKPIPGDTSAKVTVNGVAVATGLSSPAVLLNPGSNTISIVVLAPDGSTSKTYVITANRALPGIYTLPPNNFKLSVTSATCLGSDNGLIHVAVVQPLNYTALITGTGFNKGYSFTDSLTVNGLAAGTYEVCISVAGQNDYQQCYNLAVTEPKDLSVYAVTDNSLNTVTLALSGGSQYNITLNGALYTTADNSITLPLNEGSNDLSVATNRLCQGTFQRIINISRKIIPYPVPFQNTLNLNVGTKTVNNIMIEIHNVVDGKTVYSKQYVNQSGVLQLDVSGLKGGVYALHFSMDNTEKIFKIIKK